MFRLSRFATKNLSRSLCLSHQLYRSHTIRTDMFGYYKLESISGKLDGEITKFNDGGLMLRDDNAMMFIGYSEGRRVSMNAKYSIDGNKIITDDELTGSEIVRQIVKFDGKYLILSSDGIKCVWKKIV